MGLFDSEAGKRRLLTIEIPILERYNADRADDCWDQGRVEL